MEKFKSHQIRPGSNLRKYQEQVLQTIKKLRPHHHSLQQKFRYRHHRAQQIHPDEVRQTPFRKRHLQEAKSR